MYLDIKYIYLYLLYIKLRSYNNNYNNKYKNKIFNKEYLNRI